MFVPRCLQASIASSGPISSSSSSSSSSSLSLSSSSSLPSQLASPAVASTLPSSLDQETEEPLKERSEQQRAADVGEPTCVVCGRYGEYICNDTDEDVCSMECKQIVLDRLRCNSTKSCPSNHKRVIYFQDDCIYVKDKEQSLPLWQPYQNLTNQQAEVLRQEIDVNVTGNNAPAPAPVLDFADCAFTPCLQHNLENAGYISPTPVQMQAIPAALKGRDLLIRADTGSGKTASFLLPIIQRCSVIRHHYVPERVNPLAIVMTPTRELCAQIEEQAKLFGKGLLFKTALVVGGDALPNQLYRIKQGVELIVGTPGRLVDLLAKHPIDLDDVCMLVLDEVDCMLERGFRHQVMQIVQALSQPQIMMFSATIPPNIEKLSSSILKNHLFISVGKASLSNVSVKQTVIWVEPNRKKRKLFEILQSAAHFQPPAVVFVNSKAGADLLADTIQHMTGLKAAALHGEKQMSDRRQVLRCFLMGELPVVVSTGVLGRGLDLIRVRQVIIFDMPHSLQEYIHQIGRASRLGLPGTAMVLINNESKGIFKDFLQLLQSSGAIVPRELTNSPYAHSSYAAAYNYKRRKH